MLRGAAEPALTDSARRQGQPVVVDPGRDQVGCTVAVVAHDVP
jgi:hypothetical protein